MPEIRRQRGRPKGARNKSTADIKALAQKHTSEAINTLVALMNGAEAEAARVAAAREILDRGHGKATQAITGPDGGPLTVQIVRFA